MSYERYKDFRLAPDDGGCWDVLDKEYQQKRTFPSKAAAKRWIDDQVSDMPTEDSTPPQSTLEASQGSPSNELEDTAATIACIALGFQPNSYWKGAFIVQHPDKLLSIERLITDQVIRELETVDERGGIAARLAELRASLHPEIDKAVKKVVEDYGDTLRMLGDN